jgi:predicted O-methyltransferase YrrM
MLLMLDRHTAVIRSYPIPGQTWPAELCWLYDNLKDSKSHAEIGVYCGRSLFASCVGMENATILAVDVEDTFLDSVEFPSAAWAASVRTATIAAIHGANDLVRVSTDLRGSLSAARGAFASRMRFDSVFIDGVHNYEQVSADILEWRPLLKPGGLLCGHDYSVAFPGVMDAVNELCDGFAVAPGTRIWSVRMTGARASP